jgi:hypothetical protein
LILYFPVSSLVTLFANILQNPQDARARSDVKLMNQVVNFLSLLSVTEEHGGVKRMLGVCSEFERIAKVVLDKADKENHSRRKRKSPKDDEVIPAIIPQQQFQRSQQQPTSQITPLPNNNPTTPSNSNNLFASPNFPTDLTAQSFNPSINGFSPSTIPNTDFPLDFPNTTDFSMLNTSPNSGIAQGFSPNDTHQYGGGTGGQPSPLNMGSFQQPFVPQDLWQMPMTLEWDWADMTSLGYAPFDTGDGSQIVNGNGQI